MAAESTSISGTLASKMGGLPVWAWFVGGVGVLALVLFLHSKSSASANSAAVAAQQSPTNPANSGGGSTNVGSGQVAATLAQAAGPMAYSGGDIYNNILNQPSASATATSTANSTSTASAPTTVSAPPPPPPAPAPPPPPAPAPAPAAPKYGSYVIPQGSGQSYSWVAQHLAPAGTTWQQLYALNTNPNGPHSSSAAAKLASQGPNLLYGGQIVYYPL